MAPAPLVDAAAPPRVVPAARAGAPHRTSRPRPAAAPPTDWHCENCSHHNAARRRRCLDCGTSRY